MTRPAVCESCPLHPFSEGFLSFPQHGTNGVLLLGEALGIDEAVHGKPFIGKAGFMLTRLLGWAGLPREAFGILNSVWCRPPDNKLAGQPYEAGAVAHCRTYHWDHLLSQYRVIVPMGNVALQALTGRGGVLTTRGYIRPGPYETHVIPTVHPAFIVRGQSKYSSAFINDVQKAVELAKTGLPVQLTDYVLDPLPMTAWEWAKRYRAKLEQDPSTLLAFDIETPYADVDESERGEDDSWTIDRISFAYEPLGAMSVPFTGPYMAAIRLLLEAPGVGITWNGDNFDNPRLRAAGFEMNRPLRDAMLAWHVLHSDLPKGLAFAATFTCPWQPEWKHLSSQRPAYYSAVDSDVTLRSYIEIEKGLQAQPGLWEAYERDVIRLEPVLRVMESNGMPINAETRLDRAMRLTQRLRETEAQIEALIPAELRRFSPERGYVKTPAMTDGLTQITIEEPVKRCSRCHTINPTKPHFRTLKKPTAARPQNPCAGAGIVSSVESVTRWASRLPWKVSSKNLIQYQAYLGRAVPQKWDKKEGKRKPSMDKKGIKWCRRKWPEDPLYPLILTQRELGKIAGTYIGVVDVDG